MSAENSWVIDGTIENFQQLVLEGSFDRPVVIDFWAGWCGPCKQLAPILEKLAAEYNGKFLLVKVDTEAQEQLAASFRVQSIPFVVAFKEGQPVDQFAGLMTEEQIREWIAGFLPSPAEDLFREGENYEVVEPSTAIEKFRAALDLEPEFHQAKIALSRVLVDQNRLDEARKYLDELTARGFMEPEAQQVQNELDVRENAEEAGDLVEARAAAEANPDNIDLQIKLADALAVAGKLEEAFEICLTIISRDKSSDAATTAKETLIKLFDMAGPSSELVSTYRRKLATLLY
ncbi:Thioredoxin-2 [Polystyrenella longa]|uniref:Thioredoxin n=1 Tax=Polystyrenella longa TaxID=2528007 RepID=A0A518CMU8_9PLAN|nr:thioredoxin [Polystyrenella longa]QDU80545.1 Thioredoxin-2 [Polystyrenella longa]